MWDVKGLPQEDWFPLSGKQGKDKEGVIQLRLQFEVGCHILFAFYTYAHVLLAW
jgi:hypothetical protein